MRKKVTIDDYSNVKSCLKELSELAAISRHKRPLDELEKIQRDSIIRELAFYYSMYGSYSERTFIKLLRDVF